MVTPKRKRNKRKKQEKNARSRQHKKNKRQKAERPVTRIGPNTPHDLCSERLTALGGLLALVKFLDLIGFQQAFKAHYVSPKRRPKLGCYRMVLGIQLMLFIGFQRIGHFAYIRRDAMLCGIMKVAVLPAVTTFWRYIRSLGIAQSQALLRLTAPLRERVWRLTNFRPEAVSIDMDTTVATVYGDIQGSRKGHNTKHRGKEGLRPVLCFIADTREYLCGAQRRGATITGREIAHQIGQFRKLLPDYVKRILLRGDGEFITWESIVACRKENISFIFANRRCTPDFPKSGWYWRGDYEYNECVYKPTGWEEACRFVAMRFSKRETIEGQQVMFEDAKYTYRVFGTDLPHKPHTVIKRYDKRADVENSVGEAQREGLLAIPSKGFQTNHAYFQIVMLAYNLWRWMKLVAGEHQKEAGGSGDNSDFPSIVDNTIRVARLKMLFLAAKLTRHDNRDNVYYSIHESRSVGIIDFLDYLDELRLSG